MSLGAPRGKKKARMFVGGAEPDPAPLAERCSVLLGTLVGISPAGEPLVDFRGNASGSALSAETTVEIRPEHVGRTVTLVFVDGDPACPVISGIIRAPERGRSRPLAVCIDGERVVLTADRELVLKCGEASVTLQLDGRIVIRGTDLLSRSSGTNRIKGGRISLN